MEAGSGTIVHSKWVQDAVCFSHSQFRNYCNGLQDWYLMAVIDADDGSLEIVG